MPSNLTLCLGMLLNTPSSFRATMACQNSWMWEHTRLMRRRCAWLASACCYNKSQHITLFRWKGKFVHRTFPCFIQNPQQSDRNVTYRNVLILTVCMVTSMAIKSAWHSLRFWLALMIIGFVYINIWSHLITVHHNFLCKIHFLLLFHVSTPNAEKHGDSENNSYQKTLCCIFTIPLVTDYFHFCNT